MRSQGDDVSEADGRSDAGSLRSEEETGLKEKQSNSRHGSQRSGKSLRNEDLGELNYGSDSSSKNTNPIEYTEHERAELLRRLDSIKDHLLRGGGGGNLVDKPKEPDQNQPFLRPIHLHAPKPNPGPSNYRPYPEPIPYPGPVHGMYPQAYQDPYGFQIHRRPPPVPNPNWYHYPNMPRPYPAGQYVEIGSDIVEPHSYYPATPSRYSDLPPYSPVSSHHRAEKLTTQYSDMPPYSPVSSHHRGEKLTTQYSEMPPYSPVSSHHRGEKLATPHSPGVSNSSSFPYSINSPGPRGGHTRWPSDLDSETGGAFARGYVKKAVSDSDARRCHPLSGGAPFIACHSCFELLYLPKKKLLAQERRYKLQCGACSEVISFTIIDKKLVFSTANEETNPVSPEVEDRSKTNTLVVEERSSVDCNNSASDFLRKDEEEPVQETRNFQDTTRSIHSESQHSDDEDRSSISSEQQQKEVKSVRRRVKPSNGPEPATPARDNASLLELFEYSNVNRAALAYGMAQLGYEKPDKQKSFVKQDSLNPGSVATETEVSYNGYSNTEISEDSSYSNGREDNNRPRSRKGSSEYNSTDITTRTSTDQNEDQMKALEVWVNGHLIPEDLVCSAEKLAGPVQAGKYWYDYRAGFWGVMGKPCLGIIPPFIKEFSYPMPDHCGAGNTDVFVNGRELHKRDLELLVGRGLPQEKNRSYIVDISGRIIDGVSGEELKSLGKLAPTIEKVKHGFGMRVPRSLAS